MLKNCTTTRPLLALAVALLAAPLAANEPLTVTGERLPIYQERVSFGDLDLSRSGEQRELRKRVHNASERVCIQAEGPNYETNYVSYGNPDSGMTCADLTFREAQPQISAAIRRAKLGQPQVAAVLVIHTSAKAR